MIELIGANVKHKRFGAGNVIEIGAAWVKIEFYDGIKRLQFPETFDGIMECENSALQEKILALLVDKREQAEELKRQKQEEQERIIEAQKVLRESGKNTKKYPRENIAFKCNYCNGGFDGNGIGYVCACTDEMIDYNIEVARHSWCCADESPCKQYYTGRISRRELDKYAEDGGFVCYESQMLRNWTAFAGFALTKDNKNRPLKLNKVQLNSLAILTTRLPDTHEEDRFVFGVFLVDDAYEGDNRDEGYVTTSSKYKLSLTIEEAKKILFWNYYYNTNSPEKIAWGQGLHRYISHEQAASVLYDIVKIKKGTQDEELAQEFLEHYCEINRIKVSALPVLKGALQRK